MLNEKKIKIKNMLALICPIFLYVFSGSRHKRRALTLCEPTKPYQNPLMPPFQFKVVVDA